MTRPVQITAPAAAEIEEAAAWIKTRVHYTVTERAVYVLHVRHGRRRRFGEAAGGAQV